MDLVFQWPWAAALLVLLPLLWWRSAHLPGWQRWLRAALLACMVFALMQPSLLLRGHAPARVVVLDQRAILQPEQRATALRRLRQQLATTPAGTRTSVLQLGGEPLQLDVHTYLQLGEQSPVRALAAALERLPAGGGGELLYLGDAGSSDPHWGRAVTALQARGVRVIVDEVGATAHPPRLVDVTLAPVRAGGLATARIHLDGSGRGVQVAVVRAGVELARSPALDLDGPTDVAVSFPGGAAGFQRLRVILRNAADGREQGALNGTMAVQDPLPLLYVAADPGAGAHLQRLLGEGFAVRQQTPATLDADSLPAQDIAFLDGVGVETLPDAAQNALARAVSHDGMGLVFSGGASAFAGLAHDPARGGPLGRLLPVSGQPQERVQDPSVALVVIIDTSGSMTGAPMDLAKQVARLAVRRLRPEDRVGVVEFYGARQWSVPIQPARDTAAVERAIGRMQAQGGTQLFPAIQEAYFGLKNTDARFKHMLVITDAGVEEENFQRLLRHIAQDRINVSTALVGDGDGAARMADLANWGRGRFYQVADDSSLVELDLKPPQLQPSPGYRSGRFSVQAVPGQAWWPGDAMRGMPPLQGLATALQRPGAQVMARAGEQALVTSWQHGAGRVTTLATEPLGAGTRGWDAWPGYGAWLSRLVAGSARRRTDHALEVIGDAEAVQIVVERSDAAPATPVHLLAAHGDGPAQLIPLQAMTPTMWVARMARPADDLRLRLRAGGVELRATDGRWRDDDSARAALRYQLPLPGLATLTAGSPAAAASGWRVLELRSGLALLAIGLYLLEVLCRRWAGRMPSFSWSPRR